MPPLLRNFPVVVTLALIFFIGYSTQIFIVWPWYGGEWSFELLALLVPFNGLLALLLWNYFLCVFTDPGQVPASWKPDTGPQTAYEVKKTTGLPRFCRTCNTYKPPRTHHCKWCKRCVLKMDHHCPWVNNCVGHYNHGYFLRFLFYVDLTCLFHLIIMWKKLHYFYAVTIWEQDFMPVRDVVYFVVNYATSACVLISVGSLSLCQFYDLLRNTTTIEAREKDRAAIWFKKGKIEQIEFPYNLGWRRNLASVLGSNPLLWWWPAVPQGNGLRYPFKGDDIQAYPSWPPRDPDCPVHDSTMCDAKNPDVEGPKLPPSPWTYSNESLNPDLVPSNTRLRSQGNSHRKLRKGIRSLPPYHPEYEEGSSDDDEDDGNDDDDDDDDDDDAAPFMREGSEGYEVRPINREALLDRQVEIKA